MTSGIDILVVDDDLELERLIQRFLTLQGYDVETVSSPLVAMERVRQKKFHIAIIDIVMPEMDGLELLQRLHGYDPLLQIIVITGYGTLPRAVTALENGATDFLLKPFEGMDELGEAIRLCEEKIRRWHLRLRNVVALKKVQRGSE